MLVTVVFNGRRQEYRAIQVNGFGSDVSRVEIAFEDLTILSLPWDGIEQFSVRQPTEEVQEDSAEDDDQPGLFDDGYAVGLTD